MTLTEKQKLLNALGSIIEDCATAEKANWGNDRDWQNEMNYIANEICKVSNAIVRNEIKI